VRGRVEFTVHGTPAQQGSKTYVPTAKGPRAKESNERALRDWRSAVSAAAHQAMNGQPPLHGPLRLHVEFVFPRPRAHYRTGRYAGQLKQAAPTWCDKRPDLDKLLRGLGDALTGIAIVDDAAIVQIAASKIYGSPAAHIEIFAR
jgi:Holliday junction resolvase RusA-like endonuclease